MVDRIRLLEEPTEIEPPRVRGRPFQKGNPGRPPGSKNKITRLLDELLENEGGSLGRKMIELAKNGNVRCLQYCLDPLWPQRRAEPINLELPKINRIEDVAPAIAAVAYGVSKGTVTPEQAFQIVRMLDSYANAIIASGIAVRLEKVESVVEMKAKK
jgi:hypothetical protein